MKLILVVLGVLTLPACALAIFGGITAKNGEFPFTVQVHGAKYHSLPPFKCGGAIVSPNLILTAAHCVHNLSSLLNTTDNDIIVLKITAGENHWGNLGPFSQTRLVKKVLPHEGYNVTLYPMVFNDTALLLLNYPLEFNDHVKPILIPAQDQIFEGPAKFSGWGRVRPDSATGTLMEADFHVTYDAICWDRMFELMLKLADTQEGRAFIETERKNVRDGKYSQDESPKLIICGEGHNRTEICPGDSGSPMICEVANSSSPYICGIASWGFADHCGKVHMPAMFTRVATYSNWINSKIAEFNFTCEPADFNCGDGTCIPMSARCDRRVHCSYGTDEINCDPCPSEQFLCTTKFKCIDAAYVCDGSIDCGYDGSDESGCEGCRLDEFKCRNGTCIDKSSVCDGVKHCGDASDEFGCAECLTSEFQCKNGQCVAGDKVCDGHKSCRDGSDEWGCQRCSSGTCSENVASIAASVNEGDETKCGRHLEFEQCILNGCAFHNVTRECVAEQNLIRLPPAKTTPSSETNFEFHGSPALAIFITTLLSIFAVIGFGFSSYVCFNLGKFAWNKCMVSSVRRLNTSQMESGNGHVSNGTTAQAEQHTTVMDMDVIEEEKENN